MNYSLNWLADPYVYEVNRMDAHSDHKFFHTYTEYENEKSSLFGLKYWVIFKKGDSFIWIKLKSINVRLH